jgi:O-antigen/teichoic acid export membrane protein
MTTTNKKHSPTQRVAKNSLWLIVQPLILNVISIFVIGYIARTLGQADYGKFVFAFAFVAMFAPIANMGLRAITVREIAEEKDKASIFLGKIATLRFFLALIAVAALFFTVNLMNYPQITKLIVYIASLTIVFNAVATSFKDAFQAYEKMKYVAYTQFISGIVLTALSVIVLVIGYRLIGVSLVYCFGSFLALLVATLYLFKKFTIPKIKIDFAFWKQSLYKGAPFFFPSLVALIGTKIGIILLSKMATDASVGIYGAANNLVVRLAIIPDGICTAIFPTMAALYQSSKKDAAQLFQKFFLYLFILGLPIAVGTTILAKPIINLIYGAKYQGSILVLQILIWWLLLTFLTMIQGCALGAIHQERKNAKVRFIAIPCGIILALFLIPHFKEIGVAISSVLTAVFTFILFSIFIRRHLIDNLLQNKVFIKIIMANIAMGIFVFLFKEYNIILSILIGVTLYSFTILSLRVVSIGDISKLLKVLIKKGEIMEIN